MMKVSCENNSGHFETFLSPVIHDGMKMPRLFNHKKESGHL